MSGLKEIRRRISSVGNTKQITRAMKLVSAAKLRKAQDAAENGRAYSERLNEVVSRLVGDLAGEFHHPLLEEARDIKRRRIVFISGDRGLCGPYNTNVVKAIQAEEFHDGAEYEFVAVGRRSISVSHRLGWNTVAKYEGMAEDASQWPIEELSNQLMKDFSAGECQEVVLYYTQFISALTQRVTRQVLLPFRYAENGETKSTEESASGYYSYSPEPEQMLSSLIPVVFRVRLMQAALEAKASEHGARMTAMDAATNNANELIDKLRLHYNRARQGAITKELLDIIGGAEAIS